MLTEAEDYEEGLQGDLHNGFADEGSAEEDAEGDQEVPAQKPSQVKQRVRNLLNSDQDSYTYRGEDKNGDKRVFLQRLVNEHLEPLNDGETAVLFLG